MTYSGGSIEVASANAFSGSGTWIGATSSWSTSSNWTDGANNGVPGSGSRGPGVDTAAFSGSGAATAITLDINPNLAALSFSGSNYTLSGGTLIMQMGASGSGVSTLTVGNGTQTVLGRRDLGR